jgi:hypothetical protein
VELDVEAIHEGDLEETGAIEYYRLETTTCAPVPGVDSPGFA